MALKAGPTAAGSAISALDRTATPGNVAEHDATLGQVVGREFQRDVVTRNDADVVLAHLAAGVGDQLVTVFQRDAESRVGKHFGHSSAHFNQFFFGHVFFG